MFNININSSECNICILSIDIAISECVHSLGKSYSIEKHFKKSNNV